MKNWLKPLLIIWIGLFILSICTCESQHPKSLGIVGPDPDSGMEPQSYADVDDTSPTLCTAIGCWSRYTLTLFSVDDLLPAGTYTVHVTAGDDTVRSCYFVISNDLSQCASGHCVPEESCNAIYMVGNRDFDEVAIYYPLLDPPVECVIERDGIVIWADRFDPIYEKFQPNGPGCPPICTRGGNEILLE